METDARQRADSAFAKKQARAAEATVAWAEYQAERVALNSNMERLRAERLAREATKVEATKVPAKKTLATKAKKATKSRRQVRSLNVAAV